MWYEYRFTLSGGTDAGVRELQGAVAAFSNDIVGYFNGGGQWVRVALRAPRGAVKVWYKLPQLPNEKPFRGYWRARLLQHGLTAERVTGQHTGQAA